MENNPFAVARRATISVFVALIFATVPQAGFAANASDAEIWTINIAQSKFGPGTNTLVLEPARQNAKEESPAGDTFLVISNGKVYLATDETTAATPNDAAKPVEYTAWRGMKLVEIGDRVHSNAICSFRCQGGLPDNRPVTLTFAANGVDTRARMNSNVVVMDVP